jgi:hypothetical protein
VTALVLGFALAAASSARADDVVPAPAAVPVEPAPAKVEPAAEPPKEATPAIKVLKEKELVEADDYVLRLSLPTETDRDAWREPGLSVQLAYGQSWFGGSGPALPFSTNAFSLRTRVRLDAWWSAAAVFTYEAAGGEFSGLRWAATVEPTFHPLPDVGVSLGVGYAGLMGNSTAAMVGTPSDKPPVDRSQEVAPRDFAPGELLTACTGGGLVALARIDWIFALGPLFATGPYADAGVQWTHCTAPLGGSDAETGEAIVGRQWWRHGGATVGWWLAWR